MEKRNRNEIHSIMLDPEGGQTPYAIENIHQVVVDGQEMELDGYLDIGLIDTMKNFVPERERRKIMGKAVVVSAVAVVAACAGIIVKKKKKHYGIIK